MSVCLDRESLSHDDCTISWTSGAPRRRWRRQILARSCGICEERDREWVRDRAEGQRQTKIQSATGVGGEEGSRGMRRQRCFQEDRGEQKGRPWAATGGSGAVTGRLRSMKSLSALRLKSTFGEQSSLMWDGFLRNTDPLTTCPEGASWSFTATDRGTPMRTTEGENRSNLGRRDASQQPASTPPPESGPSEPTLPSPALALFKLSASCLQDLGFCRDKAKKPDAQIRPQRSLMAGGPEGFRPACPPAPFSLPQGLEQSFDSGPCSSPGPDKPENHVTTRNCNWPQTQNLDGGFPEASIS